jgi:hypothetical protein
MAYELAKLFDQREAWYCIDKDSGETDFGGYIEPELFYHDVFLEYKIDDELESYGFSIEDLTSEELD